MVELRVPRLSGDKEYATSFADICLPMVLIIKQYKHSHEMYRYHSLVPRPHFSWLHEG